MYFYLGTVDDWLMNNSECEQIRHRTFLQKIFMFRNEAHARITNTS